MEWFRDKMVVPPGGEYFYLVEETKTKLTALDIYSLVHLIKRHMGSNGIDIPDNIEALIEDYMCRFMPEGFCCGAPVTKHSRWLTPAKIRDGTTALFYGVIKGDKAFVSQSIARERAIICDSCEENNKGTCTTCNGLRQFGQRLIGGRKTELDRVLGVCDKCGCMLAVKVHFSEEILMKLKKHDYPEHCWLYAMGMSTLEDSEIDDEQETNSKAD